MGTVSTFVYTSDTETCTKTKMNNLVANLLSEFNGSIENANIKSTAAIAVSKLATTLDFSSNTITLPTTTTFGSTAITEAEIGVLDGVTAGTVIASKALVADASIDITGGRNITITGAMVAGTSVTAGTSLIIGSADINESDLEQLDGITAGTSAASKCVVLDGSAKIDALDITALTLNGTAVTSTAAELNKLDGASANVTYTNLNTLTAGATSDADALHTHGTGNRLYLTGSRKNQTTNRENITAGFTEVYDSLNQFNTSTGTFTAAATGTYLVSYVSSIAAIGGGAWIGLISSYGTSVLKSLTASAQFEEITMLVRFTLNDTLNLQVKGPSSASTYTFSLAVERLY